jgi:hypothetical protein
MTIDVDSALFLQRFFGANLKGEHAMTLAFVQYAPDESLHFRLADRLPTVATFSALLNRGLDPQPFYGRANSC